MKQVTNNEVSFVEMILNSNAACRSGIPNKYTGVIDPLK